MAVLCHYELWMLETLMSTLRCWVIVCGLLAGASLAYADQVEQEWRGGQWVAAAQPAKGAPAGELAILRQLMERGKYSTVVSKAKDFLKAYPDAPQREEVYVLAGQAEINRGRYWQAYGWYTKQLNEYPAGLYSQRAFHREYLIADAFLQGKKRIFLKIFRLSATDEGIEICNRVADQTPGSELAQKSLMRVGDFHYWKHDFPEATVAYDKFIRAFGSSDRAVYATLQAAKSTQYDFRDVRYDVTPLLEAQQRYEAFAQRYPSEARKEGVAQAIETIVESQAQDDFQTARYYERTHKPGPAMYYYRQVIKRFPNTQHASQAQSALARMGVQQLQEYGPAATTIVQEPSTSPATPPTEPRVQDEWQLQSPQAQPAAPDATPGVLKQPVELENLSPEQEAPKAGETE